MKCIKCGKPATNSFSPDLDIKGLLTCKECLEDVRMAYAMIVQLTPDMAVDFTKDWYQPLKLGKYAP